MKSQIQQQVYNPSSPVAGWPMDGRILEAHGPASLVLVLFMANIKRPCLKQCERQGQSPKVVLCLHTDAVVCALHIHKEGGREGEGRERERIIVAITLVVD